MKTFFYNALAEVRLFFLNIWWMFFPPEPEYDEFTHDDPDMLTEIERLTAQADKYSPTTIGLPQEVYLVEYELPKGSDEKFPKQ